jgi:threonine/homoserine/homoserine lactone efflux protein
MTIAAFLAFLGVSLLVITTPGPDTALTVRNALLGGRAGGVFTALGVTIGLTVWSLATSAGIVALLVTCKPLFLAIKYAGALYLIWLGALALRDALRGVAAHTAAVAPTAFARLAPGAALRQGLISNLGNPKIAVFFASLLPQFVAGAETFGSLFLLGSVFAAMTFAWLTLYAFAIAKAGDLLRRSAVRRSIEAATGAVLIGLGLRIAAEQR